MMPIHHTQANLSQATPANSINGGSNENFPNHYAVSPLGVPVGGESISQDSNAVMMKQGLVDAIGSPQFGGGRRKSKSHKGNSKCKSKSKGKSKRHRKSVAWYRRRSSRVGGRHHIRGLTRRLKRSQTRRRGQRQLLQQQRGGDMFNKLPSDIALIGREVAHSGGNVIYGLQGTPSNPDPSPTMQPIGEIRAAYFNA